MPQSISALFFVLFAACSVASVASAQTAQSAMSELLENRRSCFSPNELNGIQQDLSEKKARLEARAVQLIEFEAELANTQRHIVQEQEKLSALIDEYNRKFAYAQNAAQQDIETLADVYEAMEPRVAAQALTNMPPSFSSGLVRYMDEQKAARILRYMTPSDVSQLSMTLASRNATSNEDIQ